jgi:DNA repair protein RadC
MRHGEPVGKRRPVARTRGNNDFTPVCPYEVVKRALAPNAAALIPMSKRPL